MADSKTNRNIEDLRASLADKLEELRRRANRATTALTPSTYWNDPVVRFGIGVAIGLLVGARGRSGHASHEGLAHAIVRAGLTAATTALITRTLAKAEPAIATPAADAALADRTGEPAP
jgi:hypothetical protein